MQMDYIDYICYIYVDYVDIYFQVFTLILSISRNKFILLLKN